MVKRVQSMLAAICCLLLVGSVSAQAQQSLKLGIGVTSDFLAAYMAIDQGLFEKRGLQVTPVSMAGTAGSNQIAALVAGSIDVLANSAPALIQSVDAGLPLVGVANGSVLPTFGNLGIVARTGSNIKVPADLVNRKVAVAGLNSILHFAARNWLSENGVDYNKVQWLEVLPPQMTDLMKSGQFDAAVMTDPFFTAAVTQGVGYDAGKVYAKAPAGVSLAVYISTTSWAETHPKELAAFRLALADGMKLAQENQPLAMAVLAKYTKLPPQALALIGMPNLAAKLEPANLQWWVDVLKKQDVLTGDTKVSDFILP
ncbi:MULTISPECIES: ABC transporter substrate-binding protein [Rhodopseudomonas]|nr:MULTISPECIES: ABC transporter substrate-binding protein [Rhodopseudomonas]MDF3809718.1 ABC transporter substrate-binding protein [Rhodopseudomonas sp. BAL398]WOK17546.1 ABC transporter substrate-binding protein [Rhodopseudomonas sp. BAL398]